MTPTVPDTQDTYPSSALPFLFPDVQSLLREEFRVWLQPALTTMSTIEASCSSSLLSSLQMMHRYRGDTT